MDDGSWTGIRKFTRSKGTKEGIRRRSSSYRPNDVCPALLLTPMFSPRFVQDVPEKAEWNQVARGRRERTAVRGNMDSKMVVGGRDMVLGVAGWVEVRVGVGRGKGDEQ